MVWCKFVRELYKELGNSMIMIQHDLNIYSTMNTIDN